MSRRLSRAARAHLLSCVQEMREREATMGLAELLPLLPPAIAAAWHDLNERVFPMMAQAAGELLADLARNMDAIQERLARAQLPPPR